MMSWSKRVVGIVAVVLVAVGCHPFEEAGLSDDADMSLSDQSGDQSADTRPSPDTDADADTTTLDTDDGDAVTPDQDASDTIDVDTADGSDIVNPDTIGPDAPEVDATDISELDAVDADTTDTTDVDMCADKDDDGVTDCAGDCDDGNPAVYPGALELCGDGIDNDCSGDAETNIECPMGLGTYVSASTGTQTGLGTRSDPVASIAKGIQNAVALGNGQPVFVAGGRYSEKIALVEGVSLQGGYRCGSNGCDWSRDPSTHVSTLEAVDTTGLVAGPTITRKTRVDGFRIQAQDVFPGDQARLRAVTIAGGSPTISNNAIEGGTFTQNCNSWCATAAVQIEGPMATAGASGPLIEGNTVTAGNSPRGSHAVLLEADTVAEIVGNELTGGQGRWSRTLVLERPLPGVRIVDNDIEAGFTDLSAGGSFAIFISGPALIEQNRINVVGRGGCGSPPSWFPWCGGLEMAGSNAVLHNNVIYGVNGPQSVGILMGQDENQMLFADPIVVNNVVDGGAGTYLSTAFACHTSFGSAAVGGRFRNNIVFGGQGSTRVGFYEADQNNGLTCEPRVYDNNDVWFEGAASGSATDVFHRRFSNTGKVTLIQTLSELNMLSFASSNIHDDPLLDSTFHLQTGSPCIDNGVADEAPDTDIDGDSRPLGSAHDIGVDEVVP